MYVFMCKVCECWSCVYCAYGHDMSMCVAVHSRGMRGSISVCYFIHNILVAKKNKHKPDVHNRNSTTVYIRFQ